MAKEILLYSGIYDFTAEDIIGKLNENMSEAVDLRTNCPGGSVFAGWGIAAKIKEHGNVNLKVDGLAASMGAVFCLYSKSVECLSVSRFMLHRADMRVESPDQQAFLDSINKDLKTQMMKKLDAEAFLQVSGMSIDAMFEGEQKDVWLTAKQAKKIKLVDSIKKLEPSEAMAMNEMMYKVAASMKEETKFEKPKSTIMNLQELKQNHPAIFAEAVAIGVAQEKDRVESCLVFNELDPKGVKEAIESGKPLSQKQMADFSLKSVQAQLLAATSKDNAEAVETTAEPVTTKENKDIVAKQALEAKKLAEILAFAGVKGEKKAEMVFSSVVVE